MLAVKKITGSFRDPSGHVYQGDGRIFRTVNSCFASDFEYVRSSGILEKLANAGQLLPVTIVPDGTDIGVGMEADTKYILETPKLPFISYPYEWPFSALKAAALLHLEIHLSALEEGVTLSDASAYNIQFQGPRPIFIDHLSFRPYQKGEVWFGHRQFCEQFLNPLLLQSYFGLSHNAWYRGTQEGIPTNEINRLLRWRHFLNPNVCMHIVMQSFLQKTVQDSASGIQKEELGNASFPLASFQRMLQRLYTWIAKLQPQGAGKTVWQDYVTTHNYSSKETGEYSKVALQEGAESAVGFDADHGALEAAFERACEEGLALQPVYLDMTFGLSGKSVGEWSSCPCLHSPSGYFAKYSF
jgi:ribosomal protein L11 methylase PrmA